MKNTAKKCIKPVCLLLAAALTLTTLYYWEKRGAIEAFASQDTLPGVEQIRTELLETKEPYRILEITPGEQRGEFGFYVGGQEPFPCLWDEETGRFADWKVKLASFGSADERAAFMERLAAESALAADALLGEGEPPFSFEPYAEVDADTEGADYVEKEGRTAWGYFAPAGEDVRGDWNAVFKRLMNQNVPLDEINNGKGTPYYKAFYNAPLKAGELSALAAGVPSENLYRLAGGIYMEYAGTAAEAWEEEQKTVSGNDPGSVTGGDSQGGTVSGGDAERETGYYRVAFRPINDGTGANQAVAGDQVYVLDVRNTVYEAGGGAYKLVETVQGALAGELVDVPGERVYFTGGLRNAELFRAMGLGLDEEEWAEAPVTVDVCTPARVNGMTREQIDAYDMLYIGTCGLWNRVESADYRYGAQAGPDLTFEAMERLALGIQGRELSCVTDLALLVDRDGNWIAGNGYADIPMTARLAAFTLSDSRGRWFTDGGQTALKRDILYFGKDQLLTDESTGRPFLSSDTDRDLSLVNENTWLFHSGLTQVVKKGGLTFLAYGPEKAAGGFDAVLQELRAENMYRETDVSFEGGLLAEEVSDAAVLRYLINYPKRRETVQKSSLRVLEIQPATSSPKLKSETVSEWTGIPAGNITVETVPVTKFIGLIGDLNSAYDMIYIGSSPEGFNRSAAGGTVFNDTGMNGLVYSHVGDIVAEHASLSGLLDTDFASREGGAENWRVRNNTLHRYTGNDITPERYNDLLDFLDAYYPVVFAEDLITQEAGSRRANEKLIDNSSYLYELIDEALAQGRKNIFTDEELNGLKARGAAMFNFCINKPKMRLAGFEMLDTVAYRDGNELVRQITRGEDGKFYVSYRFSIANEGAASAAARYSCRLYIDINADGKFSPQTEILNGISVTDGNGPVDPGQLKAGVAYTVTRQIPENFDGCITWNLEVTQNDNALVRTNRTGYVRLKTDTAVVLKVLQIYFHNSKNINLEKSIGKWNGREYEFAGGDGVTNYFNALANEIRNEYIFDITALSRSEYERRVHEGTLALDSYDMLIIGFSDANNGNEREDWNEEGALEIRRFIESGRSVLFAHDASSPINLPSTAIKKENGQQFRQVGSAGSEWYWGYNMNRYIRNLVGMDAYGVTMAFSGGGEAYGPLNTGRGLTPADSLYTELSLKKDGRGRYPYGVKDLAYTPRSARSFTVGEVQGYTYQILNSRAAMGNSVNRYGYREGTKLENGTLTVTTTQVKRVNEGQITSYPYAIGALDKDGLRSPYLNVGDTHSQYYALDMNGDSDGDGQTDLVVWYCLDGNNVYGRSEGDVRSNYYIYSKGNIMYTGMGHRANQDIYRAVTQEEAKLFINTIVASYQTGSRAPEAKLAEDSVYRYTDALFQTEDEPVEIAYRVNDLNMTAGVKAVEVRYFAESADGAEDSEIGGGIRVVELQDLQTVDGAGRPVTDMTQLKPDQDYRVTVPASWFTDTAKNGSRVRLFIKCRTVMTQTSITGTQMKPKITPWGYGEFTYVNCELFDLD